MLNDNTIIELNGPIHYAFENSDILNAKTKMKSIILELNGYKVININHIEINKIKGVTNKINFLNNKIFS